MSYYKRTTCRLCESNANLSLALHYPPQPLADNYHKTIPPMFAIADYPYPLDLYLCDDCGCAQICWTW